MMMMTMELTQREAMLILRRRKGITLKQVSENTGISMSMVSRYEKGEKNLGAKNLEKYCQFIENY